jgi:acetyl-CoA carboxylase carboxyl transferase subunit alpha
MEMAQLKTPIIAAVIGEGGSGGALGIGVADRILMLQYSYYSVISPEGCAAILWRGEEKEHLADAANILKLTADDLYNFDILDEIVPEPLGGAHRDHNEAARLLKEAIIRNLKEILKKPIDELLDERYKKYRRIGRFVENREREVSGARVERSGGDS